MDCGVDNWLHKTYTKQMRNIDDFNFKNNFNWNVLGKNLLVFVKFRQI